MAAPKGNEYWKLAQNIGRPKLYKTPDELAEACKGYFRWVSENPMYEEVAFSGKDRIRKTSMKKMRAMSIGALCVFLGIHKSTFLDYESREEYSDVATRVRALIEMQQFEGASAGLLNPSIIARSLGLIDKQDLTSDGKGIKQQVIEKIVIRK